MGVSLYAFPHKHLADRLFGEVTDTSIRRIEALLEGEKKMTVDILYILYKMEPMIDLEKSLQDLYARYELAEFRKQHKKRTSSGPES